MSTSRHDAIIDWLGTCPRIKDLYLNFSKAESGATQFVPLAAYADTIVRKFINGSRECAYDFTLVRFEEYSTDPDSRKNLTTLEDIEAIAQWVSDQADAGNYPTFPAGSTILSIEALPSNIGYVAAFDNAGAKYSLQFRINYFIEEA